MSDPEIEEDFPRLKSAGSYYETSPKNNKYNCIAWAAYDTTRIWQLLPFAGYYWPASVPNDDTLESWIQIFELEGYQKCDSRDLEEGFEKIAIYLGKDGEPSHIARQLASGLWTSKLGYRGKDIVHRSLESLESDAYGAVAQIMKRKGKAQQGHEIKNI